MAGKKKAKKKVSKKAVAKVSNRRGRIAGSKNKPKAKQYAYAVVDSDGAQLTLGMFATVDAARDAIEAQAELHSSIQAPFTPNVPEVSDEDIMAMAQGETVPEPVAPTPGHRPLSQFEWTIVVLRVGANDTVHAEW